MLKFICLLLLSSRSFIVLCFTFRLKIDFELIFLKCVKSVSRFFFFFFMQISSLIAQSVKSLTAMQETWVQFLGWEDPLDKEMATHSSVLAWRIPWKEEPGRLQSMGSQESDTTE